MARPYRKLLDVSDLPNSGGSQFNTGSYLENPPRRRLRRLRRLAGLRDVGTDQFNADPRPCGPELSLAVLGVGPDIAAMWTVERETSSWLTRANLRSRSLAIKVQITPRSPHSRGRQTKPTKARQARRLGSRSVATPANPQGVRLVLAVVPAHVSLFVAPVGRGSQTARHRQGTEGDMAVVTGSLCRPCSRSQAAKKVGAGQAMIPTLLQNTTALYHWTFGVAYECTPNIWDKSPMRSEGMLRT